MLRRLRSCGTWEVHAVHHARHQDIIAVPGQRIERDAALAVVRHVARSLGCPPHHTARSRTRSRGLRPRAKSRQLRERTNSQGDDAADAQLQYHVLIAHGFLVSTPTWAFHTFESQVEAAHMLDDHLPHSRALVVSRTWASGKGDVWWGRVLVPSNGWHLKALARELCDRFPGLPHKPDDEAIERIGSSAWTGAMEASMRELGKLLP